MKNVKIPRYIDAAPQIFFWEIDEFMILAACFGAGIMFGGLNTLFGIVSGFFLVGQFKKYKQDGLPGQLNHYFHWKNILSLNPTFPRSGVRRMMK